MEAKLIRSGHPELLVHAWQEDSSRPNPPVLIPKSYVTKASKGLKVLKSGKNKEITFHGGSFREGAITVYGDLKHDDMRAVAVYVLEFEEMLLRSIGGKPRNIPYYLRFYADRRQFQLHANAAGAAGAMSFYDPHRRSIVMWFDETITHNELQALVAHEFTHAYMDIVFDCISPLWFAEGMAEYFQHFTWKGDHVEPGALNEREILNIVAAGGPIPLERFVTMPREEMYGRDFKRLYAQAWTLVHYLAEYEPEKIQELLHKEKISVQGVSEDWSRHLRAMTKPV